MERVGVTDCTWLTAVREHHKQVSGKGYPTRTNAVNEAAQILRMADQFIARISPRTVRKGMSIQEVTWQTFRDDQGGADYQCADPGAGSLPSRRFRPARQR